MDQAQPGSEPVQTAAATPPAASGAEPPKQDIYEKYGISKTGSDGKPKSQNQLYKELRAAQLEEKRRANPNYGTIWNMGNVFKDGIEGVWKGPVARDLRRRYITGRIHTIDLCSVCEIDKEREVEA